MAPWVGFPAALLLHEALTSCWCPNRKPWAGHFARFASPFTANSFLSLSDVETGDKPFCFLTSQILWLLRCAMKRYVFIKKPERLMRWKQQTFRDSSGRKLSQKPNWNTGEAREPKAGKEKRLVVPFYYGSHWRMLWVLCLAHWGSNSDCCTRSHTI